MSGERMGDGLVLSSRARGALTGAVRVPGDKSISHRAVILGSLAEGESHVTGLLEGEDVKRTVAAFRQLGVDIERLGLGDYRIQGVGLDGLAEPDNIIDLGNSGTGIRLLAGVLSSQRFLSILTGDASLRSRPMGRVVTPLTRMGARIIGRDGNRLAPLVIQGNELIPMDYESPHASAQVKSAILLAGLNTAGETSVKEPAKSRDHTERMLAAFGAELSVNGLTVRLDGWPSLTGQRIVVPGDISSAAFVMVAATIVPGSDVTIQGVGVNPTRTGLLDLLLEMGADITLSGQRMEGGEPVADLRVRHASLKGIVVPEEVVPRAIDEFPILFTAAACAEGVTEVSGALELRVKESDRISAMALGLSAMGAQVVERADGLVITGSPQGLPGGVRVDSATDHRVAMSLLVAGLRCQKAVSVARCDNIDTSFPGFRDVMNALGAMLNTSDGYGEGDHGC